MTLEEIIEALRAAPNPDALVRTKTIHRNGSYSLNDPGVLVSWRGVYAEPTLEPRGGGPQSAKDLKGYLEGKLGTTMHGWKGGEFPVQGDSTLWADMEGEYTRSMYVAVDVVSETDAVYLLRIVDVPY